LRLLQLSANDSRFKTVNLRAGMNLIVAERNEESSQGERAATEPVRPASSCWCATCSAGTFRHDSSALSLRAGGLRLTFFFQAPRDGMRLSRLLVA